MAALELAKMDVPVAAELPKMDVPDGPGHYTGCNTPSPTMGYGGSGLCHIAYNEV